MPLYQVTVKREIQVMVEIEADSIQDAGQKYESGEFVSEETVVDSEDLGPAHIQQID